MYTVFKKETTLFLPLTLPSTNQFGDKVNLGIFRANTSTFGIYLTIADKVVFCCRGWWCHGREKTQTGWGTAVSGCRGDICTCTARCAEAECDAERSREEATGDSEAETVAAAETTTWTEGWLVQFDLWGWFFQWVLSLGVDENFYPSEHKPSVPFISLLPSRRFYSINWVSNVRPG